MSTRTVGQPAQVSAPIWPIATVPPSVAYGTSAAPPIDSAPEATMSPAAWRTDVALARTVVTALLASHISVGVHLRHHGHLNAVLTGRVRFRSCR